jgi:hypothetical protein
MSTAPQPGRQPANVLNRIQRGLCAYVSYLAACEMNQAFSEYVLYEPILRILVSQRYQVICECECPGLDQPANGDKKRLDFAANLGSVNLAIEVKWAKQKKIGIERDLVKLRAVAGLRQRILPILIVFGRKTHIEDVRLGTDELLEIGKPRYANLRQTRYGCRIYTFKDGAHPLNTTIRPQR